MKYDLERFDSGENLNAEVHAGYRIDAQVDILNNDRMMTAFLRDQSQPRSQTANDPPNPRKRISQITNQ